MTTSAPFFISAISSDIDPPPTQHATWSQRMAIRKAYPKVQRLGERFYLSVDLHGEFTRRAHDHGYWSLSSTDRSLVFDMAKQRKKVRDGLSGTGLGDTDDVSPGHDGWYGLRLNRSCLRPAFALYNIEAVISALQEDEECTYHPIGNPKAPQFLTGFGTSTPRTLIPSISNLSSSVSSASSSSTSIGGR